MVEKAKTGATGALQLVHGTVAGQTMQIDLPKVQVSEPQYWDDSGIWQAQLKLTPLPMGSAGNDEIKLTAK